MKIPLIFFLIFALFFVESMATTITQDLMSPVSTDANYAFWSGSVITTFLLITEDSISDVATKNTNDRKPLGDAS